MKNIIAAILISCGLILASGCGTTEGDPVVTDVKSEAPDSKVSGERLTLKDETLGQSFVNEYKDPQLKLSFKYPESFGDMVVEHEADSTDITLFYTNAKGKQEGTNLMVSLFKEADPVTAQMTDSLFKRMLQRGLEQELGKGKADVTIVEKSTWKKATLFYTEYDIVVQNKKMIGQQYYLLSDNNWYLVTMTYTSPQDKKELESIVRGIVASILVE